MRDAIRALLVAASFLLLSSPALYGLTGFAFLTATIQLVAVIFLLTVSWDRFDARVDREFRVDGRIAGPIVAVAAGLVVFIACRVWLRHILNAPSDAPGAQTVLIQSSVRRLLQGRDPYAIAQGMSPAGPLLLVPYIGPFLLRVDLRFASLVGELFVPVATAIVAAALATQGRAVGAVAWTAASAIIVSDLSAERFAAFAHTPVYWPLLAALTWSAARQHWRAAAFLCGLLIATRWSMIAIAPVVLIGAWGHG